MTIANASRSVMFVAPSAYVLSGLATWLDYLEPGLTGLGWKVTIGLVQGPRHHLPHRYLARHPHASWYPINCMTGTPEGRARAIEKAVAAVSPDIVATVNIPDAIIGAARVRRKVLPALKIAMTIHGIQPNVYDDARTYAPWIDKVLCTNRLACKLVYERSHLSTTRIGYAPCGVAWGANLPPRSFSDRLRIAFVGRLDQEQKRVHDLPAIMRQLDDMKVPYELLIAGNGPEEEALRMALRPGIESGQVHLLGFLTPEQLESQVFKQVDVLLLTSPSETGPLVIWEAMAHGVAVVSTRYLGSGLEGSLVHESNALLFELGDCAGAADMLQRLWADRSLIQRLRMSAFSLIESRYSVPVSVGDWSRELNTIYDAEALAVTMPIPVARANSRLDRWLGPSAAETVREWRGSQGPDGGPGSEWPHSHSSAAYDDPAFWAQATALDKRFEEALTAKKIGKRG